MLTDTKLRNIKPQGKLYKVPDRDGLYIAVTPTGGVSFRYNYKINGRQETVTFGRYPTMGLAEARQQLAEAKRLLAAGVSPAREKARSKAKAAEAGTFGAWAERWLTEYPMAESTRDMRRSVYKRELMVWERRKLAEIKSEDLRTMCDTVRDRGAPATAVHVREVVMQVYRWAADRGERVQNPADEVRPSSIATFQPKERALTPGEIRLMYRYLDVVGTTPLIRAAAKLLLLTLVRKGELICATWSEINFTDALWTIPKERMKAGRAHMVPLSRQALEFFIALHTFSGGSDYVLPGRYDSSEHMSLATINRVLTQVCERAKADKQPLEHFGPHDLRRTASTLLHEAGYNSDWIEKALAHEQRGVRAVYNKAEYLGQRKVMLQDWADLIDWWVAGNDGSPPTS